MKQLMKVIAGCLILGLVIFFAYTILFKDYSGVPEKRQTKVTKSGKQPDMKIDTVFYCVHFFNAENGIAMGNMGKKGYFVKTDNGGQSWTNAFLENSSNIHDVYFPDATVGYAVGDIGLKDTLYYYKSTDGGLTWQLKPVLNIKYRTIHSVFFIDVNTGWIAGKAGNIFSTTDGGETWKKQYSGKNRILYDIHFLDSNLGRCVGEKGLILKTSNGGLKWTEEKPKTDSILQAVRIIDKNTSVAVGLANTLIRTLDNGKTWNVLKSPWNRHLINLFVLDKENLWLIGLGGGILKAKNDFKDFDTNRQDLGANVSAVTFIDKDTGWAVGTNGLIAQTINSGLDWKILNKKKQ